MKNCPTCLNTYPDAFTLCPLDGTALVESVAWTEGAIVRGKYRILSKLGQGGMAAVYKAVHLRFNEVRALKVMSPKMASDPIFVKRFEHEAVITRKLQHPNAVRVDDIDEAEDGRPFIVMEFIEGKSLKKVIELEAPMPISRVCAIIKQVAAALGAAHELGMVHRDIKPDNIALVVTPAGEQAKVLDFGIAKLKEAHATESGDISLTGTGAVIGTPQYMSPEQANGMKGDQLDGRSDLYSLGIVMYQMLTWELPFNAKTTMEMLIAHIHRPPKPIGEGRPDLQIPDAIANLVMRCLDKTPEGRPASARVFIEELERAEKQPALPLKTTAIPGRTPPIPVTKAASPQAIERDAAVPPRRPEARPRPQEAPRQPAARLPQHAAPAAKASLWKVPAAVATAFVIVAVAAWYFSGSHGGSPNRVNENKSGAATAPPTGGSASAPTAGNRTGGDNGNKGESQVAAPQPSQQPTNQRSTTPAPPKTNLPEKNRQPGGTTKPPPPKPAVSQIDNAERQKQINAAKTEGDLYFENGEYDNAIAAYQNGLKADPKNSELLQKIQKARNAKATEGGIQ